MISPKIGFNFPKIRSLIRQCKKVGRTCSWEITRLFLQGRAGCLFLKLGLPSPPLITGPTHNCLCHTKINRRRSVQPFPVPVNTLSLFLPSNEGGIYLLAINHQPSTLNDAL